MDLDLVALRRGLDVVVEVEQNETLPPLAALISFAAVTLLFVADLHVELIRGLAASYDVVPVGLDFDARVALRAVADARGESFRLSLRVASPFVIYALIVNLARASTSSASATA